MEIIFVGKEEPLTYKKIKIKSHIALQLKCDNNSLLSYIAEYSG